MGVTSSSGSTALDARPDESDLYPELPVKKKFGETVVKLIHVKKGNLVIFVTHLRIFTGRKRRSCGCLARYAPQHR